jgi:lysophospholipase L1-like esterase
MGLTQDVKASPQRTQVAPETKTPGLNERSFADSLARESYLARKPLVERAEVFAIGDSNTDWSRDRERRDVDSYADAPPQVPIGWVDQLNSQTDESGGDRFGVVNRGFAGATVASLQNEVSQFTASERDRISKADYLVSAVGINDAKITHTDPAVFKSEYQKLIDTLRRDLPESAPIFLVVPSVLNGKHQELNPVLDEYQKAIEQLSRENKNVFVVNPRNNPDPNHPTLSNTRLDDYAVPEQDDGVHPSATGHKIVMDHVIEAIEKRER